MKLNIVKVILSIAAVAIFTFVPAKDEPKDKQVAEAKTSFILYAEDPGGLGG
ncbi:hypothetical protein ABR763_22360 [Bacillus cereus]|uniref:hypothetical protein n=1 Tax=Bacillus paranthracis TaxID=2026186 RepID=UPI00254AACFE|nr:hypothetical protein [Bacillus paranthracis]MDK7418699.1 hypothetical protein [Bacillus paranthracis]MDK7432642.1 hypothetical protein [Bacillus paranthracis]MDK7440223.1 hypothetical protein [Bacillus paranthracis]MDK7457128.1 hypothetical protein [Bacillus paranthracis]MDK7519582.1 hypothetical protein [Bacillus paranthracis]